MDLEAGIATLDFEHSGEPVHLDLEVNDDWLDPAVFSHCVRLLATSDARCPMPDPSKVFLHHDTGGQDGVIACVTRDQFAALQKAGVPFEALK